MNQERPGCRVGIFISHTSADKQLARRLAADLSTAGARVWIDEAEIKVGESLIERIRQGIDDADYLAVVLTPNSVSSEWVRKELDIAMNREIEERRVTVLPLLFHDCDLPGFLKGKKYADFRQPHQYQSALDALLHAIGVVRVAARPMPLAAGQYTETLSPQAISNPTRCPSCNGILRAVTLGTAYSGDGDYIYEEGFECCECRKDFVLAHGELLGIDPKHPATPSWWALSDEERNRLRAEGRSDGR